MKRKKWNEKLFSAFRAQLSDFTWSIHAGGRSLNLSLSLTEIEAAELETMLETKMASLIDRPFINFKLTFTALNLAY